MPLPILSHPSESLLRLFNRAQIHWSQHLAEEIQLDFGSAFINSDLPTDPQANCVLDITIPAGITAEQIVEQVEKLFADRGGRCIGWAINPTAQAANLAGLLGAGGYVLEHTDLFHLTHAGTPTAHSPTRQILPARAGFKHVRAIAEEQGNVESALLHLDDPHTDGFIAMHEGRAAAYLATLTTGEVGVIENLYVAREFRRRGFGQAMLNHALDLAARAQWRHVMFPIPQADSALAHLASKSGFVKIAECPAYVVAPAAAST